MVFLRGNTTLATKWPYPKRDMQRDENVEMPQWVVYKKGLKYTYLQKLSTLLLILIILRHTWFRNMVELHRKTSTKESIKNRLYGIVSWRKRSPRNEIIVGKTVNSGQYSISAPITQKPTCIDTGCNNIHGITACYSRNGFCSTQKERRFLIIKLNNKWARMRMLGLTQPRNQ